METTNIANDIEVIDISDEEEQQQPNDPFAPLVQQLINQLNAPAADHFFQVHFGPNPGPGRPPNLWLNHLFQEPPNFHQFCQQNLPVYKMAAPKEVKLEHYTGKNTIEAKHWLSLFEVVCAQLNLVDAEDKAVKLMSYLKDDALAFFAQRIAPDISNITWAEVRQLIEKRFETPDVSSIVTAKERKLRRSETIKDYFDDKMKHLDRTSLKDQEKADLLTDGVPDSYQTYLLPAIITTPDDWLQRALRAEMTVNRKHFT